MKKIVFIAITILFAIQSFAQRATHTFALGDSTFLLDKKPFQIISGEMHYTRIPRQYWRDRMRKAKAMGLNTIGTYVFWNAQEPEEGRYDFTGNNDIAEFVRTAQQEGLWVVLRPSPYACAEWEFGGYPWWLLKDKNLKVRSRDPKFIKAYRDYILHLGKQISPLLVTHGGNILMVQIENEYGSYGNDKAYLEINRQFFRESGLDGLLFTCDGPGQFAAGYLPGYLPAVNGEDNPNKVKELIKKYHNDKGPFYIAEWYPGWFDSWGVKHHTSNLEADAQKLEEVLSAGLSINLYMFHGGTTRDFMNGANMSDNEAYSPQTSSYDYDAPLDEAGVSTEKYYKFKEVIHRHIASEGKVTEIKRIKTIAITHIKLTRSAPLFDNLGERVFSKHPLSFEDINQGYGFVLYRTTLKNAVNGLLKIKEMRDFATIYLNGSRIGVLDRRLKQDSIYIHTNKPNAKLDILVENNGRINYGRYLVDNRQGITEKVTIDQAEIMDWQMFKFPFKSVKKLKYTPNFLKRHDSSSQNDNRIQTPIPAMYKGTFYLPVTGDTWLDMRNFGKGFVYLNGHHLGKYWNIGPQQTIYIPAIWLHKGWNELAIFDELKGNHQEVSSLQHPILNQLNRY